MCEGVAGADGDIDGVRDPEGVLGGVAAGEGEPDGVSVRLAVVDGVGDAEHAAHTPTLSSCSAPDASGAPTPRTRSAKAPLLLALCGRGALSLQPWCAVKGSPAVRSTRVVSAAKAPAAPEDDVSSAMPVGPSAVVK